MPPEAGTPATRSVTRRPTLYIHEGVNYDLYCFDIVQRFLLVLVFNKKVATSKIGTVWISTKRAIRELHDELS